MARVETHHSISPVSVGDYSDGRSESARVIVEITREYTADRLLPVVVRRRNGGAIAGRYRSCRGSLGNSHDALLNHQMKIGPGDVNPSRSGSADST